VISRKLNFQGRLLALLPNLRLGQMWLAILIIVVKYFTPYAPLGIEAIQINYKGNLFLFLQISAMACSDN
jgi:hypothetical protein